MTAQDEVPLYELTSEVFIAPNLLPEGTKIRYLGVPGAAFQPLNAAAEAAVTARLQEKPNAFLNPIQQLPVGPDGGQAVGEAATAEVVELGKPQLEEVDLTGGLASPGKAKPGLTEGGKVPASRKSA